MTKARNIADLLDANGDVKSGSLDNVPAVDLTNLSATNLTSGTIPDARVSASAVSQHATSFDDNAIVNDISTLALRSATSENAIAYSTSNQFIDVFQDGSGIASNTNAPRDGLEYVSSSTQGALATYDYNGASTKAKVKWNNMAGSNGTYYEIDNDGDSGYTDSAYVIPSIALTGSSGRYPQYSPGNTGSSTYFIYDFGSAITWSAGKYEVGKNNTWGDVEAFKFEYGTDGTNFSAVDLSNITQTALVYSSGLSGGGAISNGSSDGTANLSQHSTSQIYTSVVTFSGVPSITARYFKLTLDNMYGGTNNSNAGFGTFAPYFAPSSVSATGNFISNVITAPSSTNKMGAIITYQDQAGTNTLNTDIVLQLSADGGSNFTTATLTALPDFSTGIKMAKVNDLAVTAGTSLKYKLSFANQSGSKEARIRGVSLQY